MFPTFNEVLEPIRGHIQELEGQRKAVNSALKEVGIILLLSIPSIALYHMVGLPGAIFLAAVVIVYVGYKAVRLVKKKNALRLLFKEHVVGTIATQMLQLCSLPNETKDYEYYCSYKHNSRIGDKYINSSHLFQYSIDDIDGEDLFAGKIGLTDFQFSELTLTQIRTHTNSKGQTTRTRVTMFDGILFVADFHKDFDGVTTVSSANIFNSSSVNSWLQVVANLFTSKKKYIIDLENEDFNTAFHVETTDEIKARYILSPNMMERIMKFKSRHPERVELSFVDSYMCIALSTGKNYFEPKLFEPFDGRQAKEVYEDLLFFFGMIEDFDLNTRIWNKA